MDGKKSAIVVFNKYLVSLLLPEYDILLEDIRTGVRDVNDLCNVSLFEKFAIFLITVFHTSKETSPKLSTMLQYISGTVSRIHEDFPRNEIMLQSQIAGSWYTKLRSATEYNVTKRMINLGLNVSDDALPIGRSLLVLICNALMVVSSCF